MVLAPRGQPFEHADWLFELNHDGFRALAYIENGKWVGFPPQKRLEELWATS